MAGRDDSVSFSLREIERLEEERTRREQAERAARKLAAERARAEKEAARREEEARRVEEAAARLREEDRRRREEAAHLAAIERAATERARVEAEAKAAEEVDRARRAHELALEQARSVAARGVYRWLLGASGAAILIVGGIAIAVWRQMAALEQAEAGRARAEAERRATNATIATALDVANRRVRELTTELARRSPDESAAPAKPTVSTSRPASSAPRPGRPAVKLPAGKPPAGGAPRCTGDGDPLNGCLP